MATIEKEKALDVVRQMVADGQVSQEVAEKYFPELKSEDEKIRKNIKIALMSMEDNLADFYSTHCTSQKELLAWLEKQGEKTPVDKIQLGKKYKCIASPRYSTFMIGEIYKPEDKFLCSLMNFCSDCFEPIEDGEQKPAEGSEEDKEYIEACIEVIDNFYNLSGELKKLTKIDAFRREYAEKLKSWLKSLRPQNWTKEDKERYISCLQRLGTGKPEQPETINSKWFKEHVYPQSTWKPSDEQMEAVRLAAEIGTANNSWAMGILKSMYQDLKKLREGQL